MDYKRERMGSGKARLGYAGESFRVLMKYTRIGRRLRLRDLEERLRLIGQPLSEATLSQIETGVRRVNVDDLVAIARALGVRPQDLLPETYGAEESPDEILRAVRQLAETSNVSQLDAALAAASMHSELAASMSDVAIAAAAEGKPEAATMISVALTETRLAERFREASADLDVEGRTRPENGG